MYVYSQYEGPLEVHSPGSGSSRDEITRIDVKDPLLQRTRKVYGSTASNSSVNSVNYEFGLDARVENIAINMPEEGRHAYAADYSSNCQKLKAVVPMILVIGGLITALIFMNRFLNK